MSGARASKVEVWRSSRRCGCSFAPRMDAKVTSILTDTLPFKSQGQCVCQAQLMSTLKGKSDLRKVECAKLAIAKAILQAERSSLIYADPQGRNDPFEKASDSWLAFLLRDLTRGLGKDDLSVAFENLTIINFNYDRCVEHFAYHWFQRVYDTSETELRWSAMTSELTTARWDRCPSREQLQPFHTVAS